ncbi:MULTISPECIES: M48 family metallopeptidase [Marisediminitalea]|jgi:predicted Zn-dependent protease|uniref:M48 family metallopeptidase n=1 Tax=Marisediminitalea TaxID=2662254 RepID=UPI0020CE5571|nr:M48 family metallopeptidase [Marisediminitalea aggregata]MCP3864777.1 M48 family metallopeptidase [Aestuariibacter sp.]MCP4232424.1 M48 family metallopeptidase [Aestuariibacter sp.]MCP4525893.1 M48 family metallopeptidase [Aestuariibacter sp.]MCP4948120.1 M48 family metallopeptidase [Aestuariibacter sp.]MCP5008669.1 M48 family metallopeptidase [Aestuariibacter sp.]
MKPLFKFTSCLLLALGLTACATSPTGRSQLLIFSSNQLDQMGAQAFDGMKAETPVSQKPSQNSYVQCVAGTLLPFVPAGVYAGDWEVVVFNDDQVNAFALPGGKIGVYTGLLNVAKNQHQLAAVIGHEIGHVIAQHGNERMSQSTLIEMGSQAVNQILAANEVPYNQAIMSGLGLGLQVGVQLPFSRAHESEADIIGLQLMALAGFDPRQSVDLWQNMEAASGGERPAEILSTHPAPQTRIDNLQANMDAAMRDYTASQKKASCQ